MAYSVKITMSPTSNAPTYNGTPWILGVLEGGNSKDSNDLKNRLSSVSELEERVDLSRGGNLSEISSGSIEFAFESGEYEDMLAAQATAVGGRVVCLHDGQPAWWGEVVDESFANGVYRLDVESPTMRLENIKIPARAYDIEGYPQMREDDDGLAGPMVYGKGVTESRVIGTSWDDAISAKESISTTFEYINNPLFATNFVIVKEGKVPYWQESKSARVIAKGGTIGARTIDVCRTDSINYGDWATPVTDPYMLPVSGTLLIVGTRNSTFYGVQSRNSLSGNYRYDRVLVSDLFWDAVSVDDVVTADFISISALCADRAVTVNTMPYQIIDGDIARLDSWEVQDSQNVHRIPSVNSTFLGAIIPTTPAGKDAMARVSSLSIPVPTVEITSTPVGEYQARVSGTNDTTAGLTGLFGMSSDCDYIVGRNELISASLQYLKVFRQGVEISPTATTFIATTEGGKRYTLPSDSIPAGERIVQVCVSIEISNTLPSGFYLYVIGISYLNLYGQQTQQSADAVGDQSGPVLVDLDGPVVTQAVDSIAPNGSIIATAPDIMHDILETRGDGSISINAVDVTYAREGICRTAGYATGTEGIDAHISSTEQRSIAEWFVDLCADWNLVASPSVEVGKLDIATPWANWGLGEEYTILAEDVVADSVRGLGISDLRDLINQPVFQFAYSEASKYRRSARIQRIDEDPTGLPISQFASGFPTDAIAQTAFEYCQDSRKKYGLTRQETIELRTVPESSLWPAIGAAGETMSRIEWLATRHRTISVGVHDTHPAAFARLGGRIFLEQKRYLKTGSLGIVCGRSWDPAEGVCTLSIILDPDALTSPSTGVLVDTLDPEADNIVDALAPSADNLIDTIEA